MACRHIHRKKFRAKNLVERLEAVRVTGWGPRSLSYLPDDRYGITVPEISLAYERKQYRYYVGAILKFFSIPDINLERTGTGTLIF
jgi:hypothetical protein